jgi:hypothetical protein
LKSPGYHREPEKETMSNRYLVPDVDNITPDDLTALGLEDLAIRYDYLMALLVSAEGMRDCYQDDAQVAAQALRKGGRRRGRRAAPDAAGHHGHRRRRGGRRGQSIRTGHTRSYQLTPARRSGRR